MKPFFLFALVALVGCANKPTLTAAQITQNDPTVACFARINNDPQFEKTIAGPLGLKDMGPPSIELLANKDKPNEAQRSAISAYGAARMNCMEAGSAYRQANMPPVIASLMDEGRQNVNMLLAKLYRGDLTFGEFHEARVENGNRVRERMRVDDRYRAEAQANAQARSNAALGAALQNYQTQQVQQQQLLNQQLQQQIRPPTTTTTNCNRFGNQVNCTTY